MSYRGRCIGRIVHFLRHYCDYTTAEHSTIGANEVKLCGGTVATFTWDESFGYGDVPVFSFVSAAFAANQRAKREYAVLDGCELGYPSESARKPVDRDVLRVLALKAMRDADLYGAMAHEAEPAYFIADGKLFAEMPGNLYAWDQEAGWLLWWVPNKYEAMERAAGHGRRDR